MRDVTLTADGGNLQHLELDRIVYQEGKEETFFKTLILYPSPGLWYANFEKSPKLEFGFVDVLFVVWLVFFKTETLKSA